MLGSPGGKKHKYAKQWGFTIVNPQWINDSVKKGFAQLHSLDKYKVESYDETMPEGVSQMSGIVEETVFNETAGLKYVADLERQLSTVDCTDADGDLFEEMRFFISGFSDRHKKQIESALRKNGGFVLDKLIR